MLTWSWGIIEEFAKYPNTCKYEIITTKNEKTLVINGLVINGLVIKTLVINGLVINGLVIKTLVINGLVINGLSNWNAVIDEWSRPKDGHLRLELKDSTTV